MGPFPPSSRESPFRDVSSPHEQTTLTLITPVSTGNFTVTGGLTKTIITTLLATGKALLFTISHASAVKASATQAYASFTNPFLTSMAISTALYRAVIPQTFDCLMLRVLTVQDPATQAFALITKIVPALAIAILTHITGIFMMYNHSCASACSADHFFFLFCLAFFFFASPLSAVPPF